MKYLKAFSIALMLIILMAFTGGEKESVDTEKKGDVEFRFEVEQFADLRILQYQVPGFEELPLKQKQLLYYLYQASLAGRDIIYDQNYKHNLTIRRTLEEIVKHYEGERNSPEFEQFMVYTKRVWFSNGIHHHYSTKKILPDFEPEYFVSLIQGSSNGTFPLKEGQTLSNLTGTLIPYIFSEKVAMKRVNLDPDVDIIASSANNYYENVTLKEVETFYKSHSEDDTPTPISYGLNSKLIKENNVVREKVWKVDGMYSDAIKQIIIWLALAAEVAEDDQQKDVFLKLIKYYKSGDLKDFDDYNVAWVKQLDSDIDLINGFIEVYGDALGYRGAYESVLMRKDHEASKRMSTFSDNAQWFEDHAPIPDAYKKTEVKGISANVVIVIMESGDASPSTPIGINLPNAGWIRKAHGSKSVSLSNIIHAYGAVSAGGGYMDEFGYSKEEKERYKEYGSLAHTLLVDLHEVIGHASGQIKDGVGTPKETLKNYASTLEEGRADLFGLYFIMDQKLIDLGLMNTMDVAKTEYDNYISNGMMWQLKRIELGDNVEESHMRNRQMIAQWAYAKGKADNVIERKVKNNKTYFIINDYMKLRELFGELLGEIQRIKSEGDYEAGKNLVETYGVKVDKLIHKEMLERYEKLGIAPYSGFINPQMVPVMDGENIIDVKIEYPKDFTEQMLHYAKHHSFLPDYN